MPTPFLCGDEISLLLNERLMLERDAEILDGPDPLWREMCITKTEKAEREAQRVKPKGMIS